MNDSKPDVPASLKFYSADEIAQLLSISRSSVSAMITKGELRAICVSGTIKKRWRVSAAELQRFCDSRETNAPITATRTSRDRLKIKKYV